MAEHSALGGIGRAFANRFFRFYFCGLIASTSGFWAARVALAWLMWELTHSPAWLGIIVFVEVLPMLALMGVGGAVADRKGSLRMARLTIVGWLITMIALATTTLTGVISKELLLVLVCIEGAVVGFSNPSHLALVAKILPRQDLSAAVALQSAVVQTGRFIGPALAGPVLATWGAGWVFAVVALCFATSGTTLLFVRTHEPEHPTGSTRSVLGDFADGLRYTANHFAIRTIIIYTAIVTLLLRPVIDLLPGFADRVFMRGAEGLAWLLMAFGLGSIVSAVHIAFRAETKGLTRVFIINIAISAAALLAFALTSDFWIALVLTAIFGMSSNTYAIASQSLAQHIVAGHMRARVMSILGLTFRAVPAAGALVLGWAQSSVGLAEPVIGAALLCIVSWLGLVYFARTRALARAAEERPAG